MFSAWAVVETLCRRAGLIIDPLLVPAAPKLITAEIDQGGTTETSRPTTHSDSTYVVDDVVHYCVHQHAGRSGANAEKLSRRDSG